VVTDGEHFTKLLGEFAVNLVLPGPVFGPSPYPICMTYGLKQNDEKNYSQSRFTPPRQEGEGRPVYIPPLSELPGSSWFFERDCGGEDLRLTSGLELGARTLLVWAYSLTNGVPGPKL